MISSNRSDENIAGSEQTDVESINPGAKVDALKELILGNESLNCPLSSEFLLRFLRARKFDVERAFRLIQKYFRVRIDYPELFLYIRPSELSNVFQDNFQIFLPQRDQYGRKVFIYKPGRWNPDHSTLNEVIRSMLFCLEFAIREEETQINGIVAIVDWKDFGFRQMKEHRPWYAKKLVAPFQDCFPGRYKACHIVGQSFLFDIMFALVKPLASEKLIKRAYFHGENLESLHKYINPEILPEELGGSQPPMDNSSFVQELFALDDEIAELSNYGYKNSKLRKKWLW